MEIDLFTNSLAQTVSSENKTLLKSSFIELDDIKEMPFCNCNPFA